MPRAKVTAKSIAIKIKKGDGQGEGEDHRPWQNVRSFSSQGQSSRIPSPTNNLVHHTFSALETAYVHIQYVTNSCLKYILDQIALLPLSETEDIAERWKIRHPADPKAKQHVVMTTDFLVIVEADGHITKYARTIKYSKDLSNSRVIAKFTIESLYWKARNIDWGIVTEMDLDPNLVINAKMLFPRLRIDELKIAPDDLQAASSLLTKKVLKKDTPLCEIAQQSDAELGLPDDTCLAIAYHLIARGKWKVDLCEEIDPGKILNIQTAEPL